MRCVLPVALIYKHSWLGSKFETTNCSVLPVGQDIVQRRLVPFGDIFQTVHDDKCHRKLFLVPNTGMHIHSLIIVDKAKSINLYPVLERCLKMLPVCYFDPKLSPICHSECLVLSPCLLWQSNILLQWATEPMITCKILTGIWSGFLFFTDIKNKVLCMQWSVFVNAF